VRNESKLSAELSRSACVQQLCVLCAFARDLRE